MVILGETMSRDGKKIRLTQVQWQHIIRKRFPRILEIDHLLDTIKHPNLLFQNPQGGEFHAVKTDWRNLGGFTDCLVVLYRTFENDGFIITAIPMNMDNVRRRYAEWPEL